MSSRLFVVAELAPKELLWKRTRIDASVAVIVEEGDAGFTSNGRYACSDYFCFSGHLRNQFYYCVSHVEISTQIGAVADLCGRFRRWSKLRRGRVGNILL